MVKMISEIGQHIFHQILKISLNAVVTFIGFLIYF